MFPVFCSNKFCADRFADPFKTRRKMNKLIPFDAIFIYD
jgi:hypothetical protein